MLEETSEDQATNQRNLEWWSGAVYTFFDASESCYGQATYRRLVNKAGEVHCSLIIPESRVAPLKYTSIPRLEWVAADLST